MLRQTHLGFSPSPFLASWPQAPRSAFGEVRVPRTDQRAQLLAFGSPFGRSLARHWGLTTALGPPPECPHVVGQTL